MSARTAHSLFYTLGRNASRRRCPPKRASLWGSLMGHRRKQTDVEQLDLLLAVLLRAKVLLEGQQARPAAAPTSAVPRERSTATAPLPSPAVELALVGNRLHVTLRGFLDVPQAEAMLLDLERVLRRMQPGFDVISDVSRLGGVTSAALPLLRRAATALVEAGMRQMVRVVGSAPGAAVSAGRAAEGVYQARVVTSAAEARRLLDGLSAVETAAQTSPPAPRIARRRGGRRRETGPGPVAKVHR